MEKMKREENHPQSNIMKLPKIEETELTEVINNIKMERLLVQMVLKVN